jgi:hypothetical protein
MKDETLGNSQAFASIAVDGIRVYRANGLTKREYFAAIALQGILSQHDSRPSYAATLAVEYADALIDALNK